MSRVRSTGASIALEVEANCAFVWESASLCNSYGAKCPLCLLALGTSGCFEEAVISPPCETIWTFSISDSGTSLPAHPASGKVVSQTPMAG